MSNAPGKDDELDDKEKAKPNSPFGSSGAPKPGSPFGASNTGAKPATPSPYSSSGGARPGGTDAPKPAGGGTSSGSSIFGTSNKPADPPKPAPLSGSGSSSAFGSNRPSEQRNTGSNPSPFNAKPGGTQPPSSGGSQFGSSRNDDPKDDKGSTSSIFGNSKTDDRRDDRRDDRSSGSNQFGGNRPATPPASPQQGTPKVGAFAPAKPEEKKDDRPASGGLFGRKPDEKAAPPAPPRVGGGAAAPAPGKPPDKPAGGGGAFGGMFGGKKEEAKPPAPAVNNRPDDRSAPSRLGSPTPSGATGAKPAEKKDDKPAGGNLFSRFLPGGGKPDQNAGQKKDDKPATPKLPTSNAKPDQKSTAAGGNSFLGNFGARLNSLVGRGGNAQAGSAPLKAPQTGKSTPALVDPKKAAQPPARLDKPARPLERAASGVEIRNKGLSLDQRLDIFGYVLIGLAAILFFGIANSSDGALPALANQLFGQLFGYGKFILPVISLGVGVWLLVRRFKDNPLLAIDQTEIIGFVLLYVVLCTLFQYIDMVGRYSVELELLRQDKSPLYLTVLEAVSDALAKQQLGGGWLGHRLYMLLYTYLGEYSIPVIIAGGLILANMMLFEITTAEVALYLQGIGVWVRRIWTGNRERSAIRRDQASKRREDRAAILMTKQQTRQTELELKKAQLDALRAQTAKPALQATPASAALGAGAASAEGKTEIPKLGVGNSVGNKGAKGSPVAAGSATATPENTDAPPMPALSTPKPLGKAQTTTTATADPVGAAAPKLATPVPLGKSMPPASPATAPVAAVEDTRPLEATASIPALGNAPAKPENKPGFFSKLTGSTKAPETKSAPTPVNASTETSTPATKAPEAPKTGLFGGRFGGKPDPVAPTATTTAAPMAASVSDRDQQNPAPTTSAPVPAAVARPATPPALGATPERAPIAAASAPKPLGEAPASVALRSESATKPDSQIPDSQRSDLSAKPSPFAARPAEPTSAASSPATVTNSAAPAQSASATPASNRPSIFGVQADPEKEKEGAANASSNTSSNAVSATNGPFDKTADQAAGKPSIFGSKPVVEQAKPDETDLDPLPPAQPKATGPASAFGASKPSPFGAASTSRASSSIFGNKPAAIDSTDADVADDEQAADPEDLTPAKPKGTTPFGAAASLAGAASTPFGSRPVPKPSSTSQPIKPTTPDDDDDVDGVTYVPADDAAIPEEDGELRPVAATPSPFGSAKPPSPFGSRSTGESPFKPQAHPGEQKPAAKSEDLDAEGDEVLDEAPAKPEPKPITALIKRHETHAAELPESAKFSRGTFGWPMPQLGEILQTSTSDQINQKVLEERKQMIEETLEAFGAPGTVVEINPGPVITQFGVEPGYLYNRQGKASRVKVSAIAKLDADLALALAARSIRIEAPVPGKGFVGIEVPNAQSSVVGLRDLMASPEFQKINSKLRIVLGKSVDGAPIVADLTTMPHMLIAGTTGSGKSVCVNAVISCLLLQNSPDDLKLVMVDPKRVELTGYNGIPHLVSNVVVDLERIVSVLKWVTREMDERYKKFSAASARNILDYNGKLGPNDAKLPYLVVIIDELADLMMLAPEETEKVLARLAQMARATGIHLILATQRPSVDVVTGLIKANFPSRISFAVASGVDSRVILDQPGAEKLLGRGDMLFQAPDAAAPVRVQGVFVADAEINKITQHWKAAKFEAGNGGSAPAVTATTFNDKEKIAEPVLSRSERFGTNRPATSTGTTSSPFANASQPKPAWAPPAKGTPPPSTSNSGGSSGGSNIGGSLGSSGGANPFGSSGSSGSGSSATNGSPNSPSNAGADRAAAEGAGEDDEMYNEAVDLFKKMGKISVTLLQRQLRVGYTRAERLIKLMKQRGVITDADTMAGDS